MVRPVRTGRTFSARLGVGVVVRVAGGRPLLAAHSLALRLVRLAVRVAAVPLVLIGLRSRVRLALVHTDLGIRW